MATELIQLIDEALALPDSDRATLASLLLKSLESEALDSDVESAWAQEAERRWSQIESGAVKTIPWEDVKARLLRQ
jgi:putative addiction module component (TIGR02574 family)